MWEQARTSGSCARARRMALPSALLAVLAACSGSSVERFATGTTRARFDTLPPTTGPKPSPPVTVAAATPSAPGPAPAPVSPLGAVPPTGLGPGDRGPQVAMVEQRLQSLLYDVARLDDVFDADTAHAVVAFQKVNGLPRTGRVTQDVADRLAAASAPAPIVPAGGPSRIEIDLPRQVLFLYQAGALARILPVSTASGKRFCSEGRCRLAVTPAGSYRITHRIAGWRKSDLGRLYNPLYFNEGIAIHGYPSVPLQPASHGCVRIPMAAAGWFYQQVPNGTAIYVFDGKTSLAPLAP